MKINKFIFKKNFLKERRARKIGAEFESKFRGENCAAGSGLITGSSRWGRGWLW